MTDAQDFTDPEWVLGAVLAQLEDLEPYAKRQVLIEAMTNVAAAKPVEATQETEPLELLSDPLIEELWEQYQSAEDQFGDDYFWTKHGHKEFIARFREALGEQATPPV